MVRRQSAAAGKQAPLLVLPAARVFLILIAVCILVRCLVAVGAETAVNGCLSRVFADAETVETIVRGTAGLRGGEEPSYSLMAVMLGTPFGMRDTDGDGDSEPVSMSGVAGGDFILDPSIEVTDDSTQGNTVVTPTPDSSELAYTLDSANISIKNNTGYEIDVGALLSEGLNVAIDISQPQVLIIHTHSSEAYTKGDGDTYTESDPWRTEDTNYSIIRVGDELTSVLESYGISVIHDREFYDYPSYTGCYSRALDAINGYLEQYPDIQIVIDLHRDSITNSDGTQYASVVNIGGTQTAQVMIVAGSDYSGLNHPEWRENLKLALQLQSAMNSLYPSLSRPICLSKYRYNQQATTGSLIVEIGYAGNTLDEAVAAARMFGVSMAAVILANQTE